MKVEQTEGRKEYVVQSKRSGELAVGRPVFFGSLSEGRVTVNFFSEIDGWLIEAPQATPTPFYLNPKGFKKMMDVLGEL